MARLLDLDRRFLRSSVTADAEQAALGSYAFTASAKLGGISWTTLLNSRLVVILGEPGSGKSCEVKRQAQLLRDRQEFALFVRLDQLVSDPFGSALTDTEQQDLDRWKRSQRSLWVFADSVDESKLQRTADFSKALRRIRRVIPDHALHRIHLVLTSRISEWRPVTDRDELLREFAMPLQLERDAEQASVSHPADAERSLVSTKQADPDEPLIVSLAPLGHDQVRRYAIARDVTNPDELLAELTSRHAWEFARRPIDVDDLIGYWRDHGRLGTLTELIEHGLSRSLRESEERGRSDPLTPEEARVGSESLAAAATLCRKLTFRIPDDDALDHADALDAMACLPSTWTSAQASALLSRPIFDSPMYGCIRFHHRRSMEYLAAAWITRIVQRGCPIDRLESMFFASVHGHRVMKPFLEPIAAWLCNGDARHNDWMRAQVLRVAPELHLRYGDPAQLPIEYVRDALRALARSDRSFWFEYDVETLVRLADPRLAHDVSAQVADRTQPEGVRTRLLLLVRHGRLQECMPTALGIALDITETVDIRAYAIVALQNSNTAQHLVDLAAGTRGTSSLATRLVSVLCDTLFPRAIDAAQVVALLQRAERPGWGGNELVSLVLPRMQESLTPALAAELLTALLPAVTAQPAHSSRRNGLEVSDRWGWLCSLLPAAICTLCSTPLSPDQAALVARCIHALETSSVDDDPLDRNAYSRACALAAKGEAIRREHFWQRVAASDSPHDSLSVRAYHALLGTSLPYGPSDMAWLLKDAATREAQADREVAFAFALNWWSPYESQWQSWWKLFSASSRNAILRRLLWKRTRQALLPRRLQQWWRQDIRWTVGSGHWWHRRWRALHEAAVWVRTQWMLHKHIWGLYSGKYEIWLGQLCGEAADRNLARYTVADWQRLRRKRGRRITRAAIHGCHIAWRHHSPLLPHEKQKPNETAYVAVAGLSGVHSLWASGELDFRSLSDADADRAVRYAFAEINDFPDWLPDLARAHPGAIRRVVEHCVSGEWAYLPDRDRPNEALARLQWHGSEVVPLVAEILISRLEREEPRHSHVLATSLAILLRCGEPPLARIRALAPLRVLAYPPSSLFYGIWMATWLQLDSGSALPQLSADLSRIPAAEADDVALRLTSILRGDRLGPGMVVAEPDYLAHPAVMADWIRLVFRHIRPQDDVDHVNEGAYTPTARDEAQEYRGNLLPLLAQILDPAVAPLLKELQAAPELATRRSWLAELLHQHLSRLAEIGAWKEVDIPQFAAVYETEPRTEHELYELALWRFSDIKREIESSDVSLRDEVQPSWNEAQLRRWVRRKLQERARHLYTVPQEAEGDRGRKPDLRFERPSIPTCVPVELKWADDVSATEVVERLENQLVREYLVAQGSQHGIFLVASISPAREWRLPDGRRLTYRDLVELLSNRAQELASECPTVVDVRVVSLNFCPPT